MRTLDSIKSRKALESIKPYTPGKPIWEVKKELNLDKVIKLASNENPVGPSPKGVQAITEAAEGLNRYPDADAVELKEAIADKLNLTKEQLIVTNGADEVIKLVSETYLNPDDEIIVPMPSFSEYDFGANLMGANVVPVQLKAPDFELDIDEMLEAITDRTKFIYICSPNNPTGTYLPKKELERLLESVPEGVLVVYDAAYSHYANAEDYTTGFEFVREGYPILVLQTFSKIYGLAGIRVGFGAAPDKLIQSILKVKEPFNVNSLAQAAATAAIGDDAHVKASKDLNAAGARKLYQAFRDLGMDYVETEANFILARLGDNGTKINDELLLNGVILRHGGTWGLPEYARVSIGTEEENDFFIEQLTAIIQNHTEAGK